MTQHRFRLLLAACAVGISTFVIVKIVHADDAAHTTSLTLGTQAFPPGGASQNAILASLTTTDSNDASWRITLYATPPLGAEYQLTRGWTLRSDGEQSGCHVARTYGDLASGTQIRARFATADSSGVALFSFDRYVMIP